MTTFINLGKTQAENFTYQDDWACISIISPESREPDFICNRLSGIIRLSFHDSDISDEGMQIITDEQSLEIVKFVETFYDKVPLIVVHCEAGISRSAAVAAAFTNLYGGSDSHFFRFFHPNMTVYSSIRKAYLNYVGEKENNSKKTFPEKNA